MEYLSLVAQRFAIASTINSVELFGNGRINNTYLVTTQNGERFVLQKVNPIFAPSVLEDISTITKAMKNAGFTTTELVLTKSGELGIIENDGCWRMLTYIEGRTVEEGVSEDEARNAMELIGKFHETFADHPHDFKHVRKGFHDTPQIMATLENTVKEYADTQKHKALGVLANEILSEYRSREHAWAHLPRRIIHGDPKLNNVRFAENSSDVVALIDLDTLGRHSVVIDVADAARSWCNRADEGDVKHAHFDLNIFRTMMEGYTKVATFLTEEERTAIPDAIAQIALELSARFLTDAYHESYFKLDHARYADLFTQNSTKARAQFALYQDILKKLPDISGILSTQIN